MTGTRASTSAFALAACLGLWIAPAASEAQTGDAGTRNDTPARSIHFDLPAQPLAEVLQAFGRMTELVVIAPSPLLEGRTSAPLSGDYPPREALQRVLAGTGLEANFTGIDEALIVPQPAASPSSVAASAIAPAPGIDGVASNNEYRAYAAMVQARLTDALCKSPQTRPGNYRLVAQLRIDNQGVVVASDMVASTGVAERDAAIERAMSSLELDSAPPAGLPEPVTILLRPLSGNVHIVCPQTDGRG
jgi:hypothetical protein